MVHLPEDTRGCKLFGTKIGRGIYQGEGMVVGEEREIKRLVFFLHLEEKSGKV